MQGEDAAVTTAPVPVFLDGVRAAIYLGLSRSGWFRAKAAVGFPKPVNVAGSGLRWRRVDLDEWAARMRPARM